LPILVATLERETVTTTGGAEGVLRELGRNPHLFRVLNPRVGPWRGTWACKGRPGACEDGVGACEDGVGACEDGVRAWAPEPSVLGLRPNFRPCSPLRARLSETLRSLGRRVDQGSAMATARWLLLMERESTAFRRTTAVTASPYMAGDS